jgi:hypothetical protein
LIFLFLQVVHPVRDLVCGLLAFVIRGSYAAGKESGVLAIDAVRAEPVGSEIGETLGNLEAAESSG